MDYESQLKQKKHFPFTVTTDLETATVYNSEIEGGSMFATSYMMMANFDPHLIRSPIISVGSLRQNENELKKCLFPNNFLNRSIITICSILQTHAILY